MSRRGWTGTATAPNGGTALTHAYAHAHCWLPVYLVCLCCPTTGMPLSRIIIIIIIIMVRAAIITSLPNAAPRDRVFGGRLMMVLLLKMMTEGAGVYTLHASHCPL
jgi:hypothetical protein